MITSQGWTVGITLFNIGTGKRCEDEALEALKCYSSQSTSMMKVDVIRMGRNDEKKQTS